MLNKKTRLVFVILLLLSCSCAGLDSKSSDFESATFKAMALRAYSCGGDRTPRYCEWIQVTPAVGYTGPREKPTCRSADLNGASCVFLEITLDPGIRDRYIEMKYKDYGTNGWHLCELAKPYQSGQCEVQATFFAYQEWIDEKDRIHIKVIFANRAGSARDVNVSVWF
jgi:hypothetical protein